MTFTVTAASSKVGRLVIEDLLKQGISASSIVAAVRNPENAADLAALGVEVREADYLKPETLKTAFLGTQKLLFISSGDLNQRVEQHRNVVDAAVEAGVGQIIYTSILNAGTTQILLAADHQATEDLVRTSGLPYVFLRNGWYLENYTSTLTTTLENGLILGSAGTGRVAAAVRADFAAAAAAVLVTDGHDNTAYELGGDEPFTVAELAAEIARQSGKPVSYKDLPEAEYLSMLTGFGLPEPVAAIYANADTGIARGDLTTSTGDLRRLIGRPTTTLADGIAAALR